MTDQNISIKIGLDTSQFSGSIKGMLNELKALQKVDLTLLKPEDAKAAISRMGDLKDQIGILKKEITAADPSAFFASFSTLAGPAVAAISGIAVGMEIFGAKTEEVEKVQRKLMAVISLLSTLQTIADANKLKGLLKQLPLQAIELKNRIQNLLLVKEDIAATIADTAAKETQGVAVKGLTTLQLLWNKAVMANPIMLLVGGIAALVGAVALLSKAFKSNTEDVKESEKAMDGTIIKNEELRKSHNEALKTMRDLGLEIQKTTGVITEQEYELAKLENKYKDISNTLKEDYLKETEKAAEKSFGFWNSVKNGILSLGNAAVMAGRNAEDFGKKMVDISKTYTDKQKDVDKTKALDQERLVGESNQKILDLTKSINESLITGETEKAKLLRDKQLKEIQESLASEKTKADAIVAVYTQYFATIEKLEADRAKKEADFLATLVQKNVEAQAKLNELKNPEGELGKLEQVYVKELAALETRHKTELTSEEDFLKEKAQLDEAYGANQQAIIFTQEKEKADKLLAFQKTYLAKSLAAQRQAEIDKVESEGKAAGASPEDIAKARYDIEKKYTDMIFDYKKESVYKNASAANQAEIDLQISKLDRMKMNEEEYQNARNNILADEAKKQDIASQVQQQTQDLYAQTAMATLQIISDQQQANFDAEMSRTQQMYDEKNAKLDQQLEYGLISQTEYNQEQERLAKEQAEAEKQLKIKQAKQEKTMALFQIAINTAMGVMKSIASVGFPAAIPMIALTIAAGLVEAAVVASKPLPQFAAGGTMKKSGMAIVGERGPEKVFLPAGSEVIPNDKINVVNAPMVNGNNSPSFEQMAAFVQLSFQQYNAIPVQLKLTELDRKQTEYNNIKINSSTQ